MRNRLPRLTATSMILAWYLCVLLQARLVAVAIGDVRWPFCDIAARARLRTATVIVAQAAGSEPLTGRSVNLKSQSMSALDVSPSRLASSDALAPLALAQQQRRMSVEAMGSLLAAARSSSNSGTTHTLSSGSGGLPLLVESSSLSNSLSNSSGNGNGNGANQSIPLASIGEETARLAISHISPTTGQSLTHTASRNILKA